MNSPTNGATNDQELQRLSSRASALLDRALACNHAEYGFSTAGCQTYDTAWIAMIPKSNQNGKEWLFPESFHWLIRTQNNDGSWGTSRKSQTARIIDTASALLALLKHARSRLQIQDYSFDELEKKIHSASESLAAQLVACNDVELTDHIGVEFVLPALLGYIHEEISASTPLFRIPAALASMSKAKNAKFRMESLYQQQSSPAAYYLEAFIGRIDFDKVASQAFKNGSMWTSPASTSAYLIHASTWSHEAEAYLRHVVQEGQGHGDGSVPGTFPTNMFEFNWIVATLRQAGYASSDFDKATLETIASIVEAQFKATGGVIGHGEYFRIKKGAIDADDTAKGLLALKLVDRGSAVSPDRLITLFEKQDGFSTFGGERDRSISSNCHVLLALLAWDDQYTAQVRKATNFICEYWWNHIGQCKDKWHLSPFYASMLTVESFTTLIRAVETQSVSNFLKDDMKTKMTVILTQICVRTMLEQYDDGSWESSCEQTAYAILSLGNLCHLCFLADLIPLVRSRIAKGVAYLETNDWNTNERYWTSKTQYSLKFVAEAYILAARREALSTDVKPTLGRALSFPDDLADMDDFRQLLKHTKHFRAMPEWLLKASLLESALWLPMLRTRRLEIFPRDDRLLSKDAYFDVLPALWVCCQNRSKQFVPNSFINDMLFMTLINIQVDEFIEAVVTPTFQEHAEELHALIDQTMGEVLDHSESHGRSNGPAENNAFRKEFEPLSRFIRHILGHERIQTASGNDQRSLATELRSFLHTQAMQMEDNSRFRRQTDDQGQTYHTTTPFFKWVRTTAADHVSTPFTFAWVCCWISAVVGKGSEAFAGATEKYLAAALARHLSTTNRMYNDLGSISRDSAECNLNSTHFPEFGNDASSPVERKKALQTLAEYEQSCVDRTRQSLEVAVQSQCGGVLEGSYEQAKIYVIGLLCDVASLWDQLYAIRDLSSNVTTGDSDGLI